jgi:hypothetical protein
VPTKIKLFTNPASSDKFRNFKNTLFTINKNAIGLSIPMAFEFLLLKSWEKASLPKLIILRSLRADI